MTIREKINALFINLGHTQNVRRRFYSYIDSAPTRFQGMIGFATFFSRIGIQKITGRTKNLDEQKNNIATMFKSATVND